MQLSEKAYRLIKEKIVTLELEPLSVIDEQVLMEELELGRTPIREALRQLANDDLVIIVPRRGMFVADIGLTDLQKIFEVRMLLEGFCARLAAARANESQIAEMEAVLRDLEHVSSGNARTLMTIDERFHKLLYLAADNEFMAGALNHLYVLSVRLWHLSLNRLGNVQHAIEQHRGIVKAIKARDGAQAEALIREHISEFQREIRAAL